MQIRTPHIVAEEGNFAKVVLMPGDPLRAKFIAGTYLENVKEIQNVRCMLAFTGDYKGKKISIMASGMGMPSMSIYSHELYTYFGVETIIRIGTAGSINENVKVNDIIIAKGARTDSNIPAINGIKENYLATADSNLLKTAVDTAHELGYKSIVGDVITTDLFYHDSNEYYKNWMKLGVVATEMETCALYLNAAKDGKKALSILTISDEVFSGKETSAEERQEGLREMIELGLNTAIKCI